MKRWMADVVGDLHYYGISQSELAAKLGISVPKMSMILHDKVIIRAGTEERVREALNELRMEKKR